MGAWGSIGKWLLVNVAPVLVEEAADVVRSRRKRPPVPREPEPEVIAPRPVEVAPTVVVAPIPIAPPAPTREWAGWNADNVFREPNLHLLATETGVDHDVLSATRNQYLALMETVYRQQMTAAGRKVNGASAAVFGSEDFRAFLKTGTLAE